MKDNTSDELDRSCSEHPLCGLSQWSCDRLQEIVYGDIKRERRDTAVEIRKDMAEFITQKLNEAERRGRIDKNTYTEELEKLVELVERLVREARVNSLLDLEQWVKLHDLEKDMILDGIEHMVKSILTVHDQRFQRHTERIAELTTPNNPKEK